MKILHYSLGFPPYRSGGMTTFCIDLMEEQIKNNYQVALLWPGRMSFFSKNIEICKKKWLYTVLHLYILHRAFKNLLIILFYNGSWFPVGSYHNCPHYKPYSKNQ